LYYFILLVIEKSWLLPHLQKGKVWPHIYTMLLVIVGWALFVGGDDGVTLGALLQKMFVPSGGVSALYFLRNYGILLAVCVLCCTSVTWKIYDWLKRHTLVRGIVLGTLFLVSVAYMVDATNSPFLYYRF
jgi:alginate O-acetyltransferase complex protein AlgI